MAIDEEFDDILDQLRGLFGEHFDSWGFVVLDEGGEMFYDFANWRVGRMLFKDAVEDIEQETGVDFVFEEEDEGEDWKE